MASFQNAPRRRSKTISDHRIQPVTISRSILVLLLAPALLGALWFQGADRAKAATTWYVDDNCTPPGSGTPADPFCTIGDALTAAGSGDVIRVEAGIYYENLTLD